MPFKIISLLLLIFFTMAAHAQPDLSAEAFNEFLNGPAAEIALDCSGASARQQTAIRFLIFANISHVNSINPALEPVWQNNLRQNRVIIHCGFPEKIRRKNPEAMALASSSESQTDIYFSESVLQNLNLVLSGTFDEKINEISMSLNAVTHEFFHAVRFNNYKTKIHNDLAKYNVETLDDLTYASALSLLPMSPASKGTAFYSRFMTMACETIALARFHPPENWNRLKPAFLRAHSESEVSLARERCAQEMDYDIRILFSAISQLP